MDKICIKNMEFYGYHGVFPEETNLGQKFRVQATLFLNTALAGRSDDLTKSVHYGEAFNVIKEIVEGKPVHLLETLAEKIAMKLLETFAIIEECSIQVEKLNPPIPGHTGTVAIEIYRRQLKHLAYVSLGTNVGDREQYLQDALDMLQGNGDIEVIQKSSIYETDPVGYTDQSAFLNIVVGIKTALSPQNLLEYCQKIENQLGRVRFIRWGPRTIDVDILLYDQVRIDQNNLQIPHPRMHERAFVLVPLSELNKDLKLPNYEQTVAEMAIVSPDVEGVRKWQNHSK
ncbi:MAG: 2-amino-4-hydroxy-6-hydroxymethyldihydropteridine diphosphokinase [Bacillales bacterium]|jgi:dihydroneopterin aldolase/2-amino-4-hydroxy-6-hydroxymethyldihydropteridine diphosphokinase|nr:2-amino-4-hydroxy-6-hydroxymethyldihydropteridine diphosphokinase [Bacillales bacterium]